MSNQFSFPENNSYKSGSALGSAVLVEDGVVWGQDGIEVSLNYRNDDDITLTENNNDSYITADETSNDTQFFSVLESSHEGMLSDFGDIVADCNNATITDTDERTLQSNIGSITGQPDIYRIEGSDDLYAFEVACDGDGNIQRFRYRLRLNENGEYEGIPDSIEFLSLDNESEDSTNALHASSEEKEDSVQTSPMFIKQEMDLSDDLETSEESDDELHVNEDDTSMFMQEPEMETIVDSKAGLIKQCLLSMNKSERDRTSPYEKLINSKTQSDTHDSHINKSIEKHNFIEIAPHTNVSNFKDVSQQDATVRTSVQKVSEHMSDINEQNTVFNKKKNIDIPFMPVLDDNTQNSTESHITERSDHINRTVEFLPELNENESDVDEYQIVDGLHVTGDTEAQVETLRFTEALVQRELPLQQQILKLQQQIPVLQNVNDAKSSKVPNKKFGMYKGFMCYVVKHPEKENVASIAQQNLTNKIVRTNPRSILKSSHSFLEIKKDNEVPLVQRVERRLPRNKEAMQARVLQNYIARTTILHAPVRQQRLPRKQTIKPVERADEEIVVQEVVVSSNGFIETTEDGVVKSKVPIKPTEVVDLSDSDDDYDPKKEYKRKKKHKKRKSRVFEIVISDSDDDSVVHIDSSAESETIDEEANGEGEANRRSSASESQSTDENRTKSMKGNTNIKRKRGRPPKRTNPNESCATDGSSSSKRLRRNTKDSLESNDSSGNKSEGQVSTNSSDQQNIKTNWKCTKCPKTFPSQGSLKSHMQYHNFHEPNRYTRQSSNKQETTTFKKNVTTSVEPSKYVCEKCGEIFKNSVLLNRHLKDHNNSKSFECSLCKKIFSDRAQLINHKRTHIKEQMFKTTSLPKHSPKSTNIVRGRTSKDNNQFKCNCCTKMFTSLTLLNAHSRTHKRFTCTNCMARFLSKLALEDHVRQNCVKQAKSPNRRLSFKARKSFIAPPQRVSKRLSLHRSIVKPASSATATESSSNESTNKPNTPSLHLQCDSCKTSFRTHTALYKHKVIVHGLNTPDKNVIKASASSTKLSNKATPNRGGVPAAGRLRSAYANLRAKLEK